MLFVTALMFLFFSIAGYIETILTDEQQEKITTNFQKVLDKWQ